VGIVFHKRGGQTRGGRDLWTLELAIKAYWVYARQVKDSDFSVLKQGAWGK
jgi:hypothetical protein